MSEIFENLPTALVFASGRHFRFRLAGKKRFRRWRDVEDLQASRLALIRCRDFADWQFDERAIFGILGIDPKLDAIDAFPAAAEVSAIFDDSAGKPRLHSPAKANFIANTEWALITAGRFSGNHAFTMDGFLSSIVNAGASPGQTIVLMHRKCFATIVPD
jgi:hypothetical protein